MYLTSNGDRRTSQRNRLSSRKSSGGERGATASAGKRRAEGTRDESATNEKTSAARLPASRGSRRGWCAWATSRAARGSTRSRRRRATSLWLRSRCCGSCACASDCSSARSGGGAQSRAAPWGARSARVTDHTYSTATEELLLNERAMLHHIPGPRVPSRAGGWCARAPRDSSRSARGPPSGDPPGPLHEKEDVVQRAKYL